jgi:HEAT repeat protein
MRVLTANEIIKLVEDPTGDFFPRKKAITEDASSDEFVQALEQATNSDTRNTLCDIAGYRLEKAAVPTLVQMLQDPAVGVRSSAADALGKIGDPEAGPALFERLAGAEQYKPVRQLLASALGAVGYRPAIPLLVQMLEEDDHILRGCAAWGLGIMCATEAEEAVRSALAREVKPPGYYVYERLTESLEALELVARTTTSMQREEAISMLLAALKHQRTGVLTTCAAYALARLGAKEAKKPIKRLLTRYPKGFLAEHLRTALDAIQSKGSTK